MNNAVEPHLEGGLRWRFDASIDLIFHTYSDLEAEQMAAQITCPVLLLSGEKALDFWHVIGLDTGVDAAWYELEQARRRPRGRVRTGRSGRSGWSDTATPSALVPGLYAALLPGRQRLGDAGIPAPPARHLSARVPCGLNSSSSSPARYCRSNSSFSPT